MMRRLLRPTVILLACATTTLAACRREADIQWVESAGDVEGDSVRLLDYDVTSERYRQWIAAHRALDGVEIGEPVDIDLRKLTEEDVDRVQRSLEDHAAARKSIESAGLSVREFVLTTIALAQPWAAKQAAVARVNIAEPGPSVPQRTIRRGSRSDSDSDSHADSDSDSDSDKKRKKGG